MKRAKPKRAAGLDDPSDELALLQCLLSEVVGKTKSTRRLVPLTIRQAILRILRKTAVEGSDAAFEALAKEREAYPSLCAELEAARAEQLRQDRSPRISGHVITVPYEPMEGRGTRREGRSTAPD